MFTRLNSAISTLIDDFGMISYTEFSIKDEERMNRVLLETDTLLQVGVIVFNDYQYGEDLDIDDGDKGESYYEEDGDVDYEMVD